MNQFTFEAGQKKILLGAIAVGVICLVITFFTDDAYHSRFWSNFLHNSVFFTGVGFLALFILSAKLLAYSGWHTTFKRVWEAFSLFILVGIVLMLVVIAGVWMHWHHLYHWADSEAVAADPILAGKSGFLNPMMYTLFTLGILGIWYLFATKIRNLSVTEDKEGGVMNFMFNKKMKVWGAIFLPIGGFTSAAVIWQWIMSIDAHWYSTLYAWYTTASWLISFVALTIILLIYLKSKGYYQQVTQEHLHDLGKYLFGFSVFWTYLWFSQYMLIWYGNVGEETVYFQTRINEYPVLFYGNLLLNFFLPFLVLMRNDTKRKVGTLVFTSIAVLFGHWLDFFQMIKPGVYHTVMEATAHAAGEPIAHSHGFVSGFSIPGLLEIGTFIGFLGLFLYYTFTRLEKAALVPKNDPYLQESLHHHV
jgi:hypothetical protein